MFNLLFLFNGSKKKSGVNENLQILNALRAVYGKFHSAIRCFKGGSLNTIVVKQEYRLSPSLILFYF